MPARVTQLVNEVSGSGQTPSARVTQLVNEISGSGQAPNAVVTQLVVEISAPTIYVFTGLLSDTLSFSDAVVVDLIVPEEPSFPLTQEVLGNLNLGLDATELGLIGNLFQEVASQIALDDSVLAYVIGHLGEEVASTLELSDALETLVPVQLEGDVASTLNSWLDSFSIFSPQLVFKQVDDSFILSDSLLLAIADDLVVVLADDFSLSDLIVITLEQRITVSDSLNNWQDYLDQIEFLSKVIADNLNSWGDSVSSVRNWALSFTDRLVLGDKLQVSFLLLALLSDTLTQSDSQLLEYDSFQPVADDFTLSDASLVALSVWLDNSIADSMSMGDDVENYLSDSEDDYYRRYLDDRNLMIGELKTFYCDSFALRDSVGVSL